MSKHDFPIGSTESRPTDSLFARFAVGRRSAEPQTALVESLQFQNNALDLRLESSA